MTDFPPAEFEARVVKAQTTMAERGLAALLLTTEPDIRYFTGFLTRFWESPTRPWFVVLPASGRPIAVIPSIGAPLMARTWVEDIRTWQSPDLADDGVSLLADTLKSIAKGGQIGTPMEAESHLRMPLTDWHRLDDMIDLTSDGALVRDQRMVKSEAEIARIRTACGIADRAFARVPEIARAGTPLDDIFRHFQMLCLEEGADWVPYLAGGAGPDGCADVISPADSTPLKAGDIMMLDTGLIKSGYFCDFDRNFAVGPPSAEAAAAHAQLIDATTAAFEMARPGITTADLFHAMDKICTGGGGGTEAGRYGHGVGMQLTEWPSMIPADQTILKTGMTLTLEPSVILPNGATMVHEENIVITATGAEFLSTPAKHALPLLEA